MILDKTNEMASVQHPKDGLQTSTPIQQLEHGRPSKRYLNSPYKEFDALSPIKSNQKNILFQNLSSLEKNFDSSHILSQFRRNKILDGVSRKLRFTELSNLIDVNCSDKNNNDSGFGSELELSKSESISISVKSNLSVDDNCNIISSTDDDLRPQSDISNLFHSDIKNLKSEVLDNRKDRYFKPQSAIHNCKLDILGELNLRNCSAVLSLILSNLEGEDLQKAVCVNREWRNIIANDRAASTRRKEYIKRKKELATGPEKENRFRPEPVIHREQKPLLLKVINTENKEEQSLDFIQILGKFDSFVQEAKNLGNEEKLLKCPKCFYPSKARSGDKNVCVRSLCKHEFCKVCLGPFLGDHTCPSTKPDAQSVKNIIGSKRSKKNLKRL